MKTVFVVGARGIPDVEGGVEKNAERLFPLLARRGWRIILIGLNENIQSTTYSGVMLRGVRSWRFLKTDKLLYYVVALFHAFRVRPDIVHLSGLGAALFLWAYKIFRCAVVVRYSSADYEYQKWGRLGRVGFRLAEYQLRFADAVISVSPSLSHRLGKNGIFRNVHLIPNAIDEVLKVQVDEHRPIAEKYLLCVGRVTSQKNYKRLIKAYRLFAKEHPNIKLVIAGGKDDSAYWREIQPLLDRQVIMLGKLKRSKIISLYRNAELYINCSMHEGHSNAILEAVSWSCPVILSHIAENLDFNLEPRFYFDPYDVENIAAALTRAIRYRESHRVDRSCFLNWGDVADRTERLYMSLCPGSIPNGKAQCDT